MKFSIDLHSHSFWSDGDTSPAELVKRAKEKSVDFLVLTDHANIDGVKNFAETCQKSNIKTLPGVELTCVYKSIWFDILIYGFMNDQIVDYIKMNQLAMKRICKKYTDWLQKHNALISWREIEKYYGTPPNATRSLYFINKYRREVLLHDQSAIDQDIKKTRVRQVDRSKVYLDMLPKIKEIALAGRKSDTFISLAHPMKTSHFLSRLTNNNPESCLNYLLEIAYTSKIEALEVRHPTHTSLDVQRLMLFCQKNNLIITGGSDYHGDKKGEHKENVHFGNYGLKQEEFKTIEKRLNL